MKMIKNTAKVPLSKDDIDTLCSGNEKNSRDCIETLFNSLDDDETAGLLIGFCTGDREEYGGDPIVADVTFHDTASGTIDVDFTGLAYYGCKDMDRLDEHAEAVGFDISFDDEQITFSTETLDPVESIRDPNDEF